MVKLTELPYYTIGIYGRAIPSKPWRCWVGARDRGHDCLLGTAWIRPDRHDRPAPPDGNRATPRRSTQQLSGRHGEGNGDQRSGEESCCRTEWCQGRQALSQALVRDDEGRAMGGLWAPYLDDVLPARRDARLGGGGGGAGGPAATVRMTRVSSASWRRARSSGRWVRSDDRVSTVSPAPVVSGERTRCRRETPTAPATTRAAPLSSPASTDTDPPKGSTSSAASSARMPRTTRATALAPSRGPRSVELFVLWSRDRPGHEPFRPSISATRTQGLRGEMES
jgi:hypothetical protein